MNNRWWLLFLWLVCCAGTNVSGKVFTVVLDPGHGGKDPGACGKTAQEKNIVLSVAKKVGSQLKSHFGDDIKIIYTRNNDSFVELEKRAQIANNAKADVFVSIHTDAVNNRAVSGASTFVMGLDKLSSNMELAKRENKVMELEDNFQERYADFDPSSEHFVMFTMMQSNNHEYSIQIADNIQSGFVRLKRSDRGVRLAPFWVLHRTTMPAVLVELGFISNPDEERYLKSEKGQNELARCIVKGIVAYKEECDKQQAVIKSAAALPDQPASLQFRVQLLISRQRLSLDDKQFKGLNQIDYYQDDKWFKYTYGHFATEKEAIEAKNQLRNNFPDAFVVAVKDGKRIDINQARKLLKQ